MADRMMITADLKALFAALDTIPDAIHVRLKAAAQVTAERIAAEARGRVQRRTGKTAEAITIEETRSRDGYVVYVGRGRQHIGSFLEFGTRYMSAKPFLFASARLEEGAHDRRSREAIQEAIAEKGLGD